MATKTLKVKQIATAVGDRSAALFAVAEDGSVWQKAIDDDEWIELPAIEVDDSAEEES